MCGVPPINAQDVNNGLMQGPRLLRHAHSLGQWQRHIGDGLQNARMPRNRGSINQQRLVEIFSLRAWRDTETDREELLEPAIGADGLGVPVEPCVATH